MKESNNNINGLVLPHYQGTMVTVASNHVHFDPKYWTNPDDFDPTRFITAEGKFQAPKEGLFAFGSGEKYLAMKIYINYTFDTSIF